MGDPLQNNVVPVSQLARKPGYSLIQIRPQEDMMDMKMKTSNQVSLMTTKSANRENDMDIVMFTMMVMIIIMMMMMLVMLLLVMMMAAMMMRTMMMATRMVMTQ